jgi:hypothetical protein
MKHGINASQLRRWMRLHQQAGSPAMPRVLSVTLIMPGAPAGPQTEPPGVQDPPVVIEIELLGAVVRVQAGAHAQRLSDHSSFCTIIMGPTKRKMDASFGEDAHDVGAPLDLCVEPLQRMVLLICVQCDRWKVMNGGTSLSASSISAPSLESLSLS